jgi:hypothetical protein
MFVKVDYRHVASMTEITVDVHERLGMDHGVSAFDEVGQIPMEITLRWQ